MLLTPFQSIATATRQLLQNWRAMLVLAALYASLLATLYFLVTIREATPGQVALTLLCAILTPFLFFLLQTASALQTQAGGLGPLVKDSIRNFWKLIVITLPLLALAVTATYLLAKVQTHFAASGHSLAQLGEPTFRSRVAQGKPPLDWMDVTLTTLRYLFIGLLAPIALIHLWIATVRVGLLSTIKGIRSLFSRAFAPQSVLIYIAGFLVFGVIPYLLVFKATPASKAWLELALFVGRLCAVFAFTLYGWAMTMSALALSSKNSISEVSTEEL
jgi:hypothetical protein